MSSPSCSSLWSCRGAPPLNSPDTKDYDPNAPTPTPLNPSRPPPSSGSDAQPIPSSTGSVGHREPIRSFIHGSVRDHLDTALVDSVLSAHSVRQDTADLASYLLSDGKMAQGASFLSGPRSHSSHLGHELACDGPGDHPRIAAPGRILEVPEPPSPEGEGERQPTQGSSIIAHMLRSSPAEARPLDVPKDDQIQEENCLTDENDDELETLRHFPVLGRRPSDSDTGTERRSAETAPLLGVRSHESRRGHGSFNGHLGRPHDLEGQKRSRSTRWTASLLHQIRTRSSKIWHRHVLQQNVLVAPVACLPAVIVGLLLNILDALSYGMILFPLGNPIFEKLGSAGISIFYVSTIIAQLTFSTGSIFKGGVGSELIEVVPFFHSMAFTITGIVGEDDPDAVIATTITSYALSSMLTGTVFYLMGHFKFGHIVGFIPRHILIGCIGGVGWFLIATGFEVSARLDGSLNYDLDTLKRLTQADTILLWAIPLALSMLLFYGQKRITSKFFLPAYIIAIPLLFYFFVSSLDSLDPDSLRSRGWMFESPPAGEPWWYFYTLFEFDRVHWGAIVDCIPAMLALTFFGILHVPINVPALALNTGQDHADLDHELKLHGLSNLVSGIAGSIQNYLVYANSVFFMRSGGDSRLAGFELAILTAAVMMIGPALIGYIPVMMVGVLIFDLGFELLLEAIWQPRKKLNWLEYLTVIVIVLIMGIYDFVVGIGVGIVLAFVSMIVQTSRVSAVRASYGGDVVGSTVRRNPTQQHYLKQVGNQIYVIKLAGYLFFGTIVSVEDKIRAIVADETFRKRPIKFLILDLWKVTGLDYSAGEAFNTINRLLRGKDVELVIGGVQAEAALGRDLRAVGLGEGGPEVKLMPELNSALEYCENELLRTFYTSQDAAKTLEAVPTENVDVPAGKMLTRPLSTIASSPRQSHLREAARQALNQVEMAQQSRWASFKEPLRLMLQIFQDLSNKNEDFWFRAAGYFQRREHAAGTVLFRRGEPAEGFYLVESGILRAEYDLPQGWLCESIVAGTTCGELPFFSETNRTATCVVERRAVLWLMDRDHWVRLQKEQPEVSQEVLRLALKLTTERMTAVTSYVLTMAG